MNLLEHYIVEIYSEDKITSPEGNPYIKVSALIDCYGAKEKVTKLFLEEEWERVKREGYYFS